MRTLFICFITLSLFQACKPKEELKEAAEEVNAIENLIEKADINPFIHHVYFYLKNPSSQEDRDKLVEGLEKLAKVETIQAHYIGFPASTDREVIEKGYAVSWLCFFKNMEEEELYQKDPVHLKFIEEYGHLWEKVIVYDSIK